MKWRKGLLRNKVAFLLLVVLSCGAMFFFLSPDQSTPRPVFANMRPGQVVQTSIFLNVSKRVIYVGENFTIRGFLKQQNGVMMSGRNVTVSWTKTQSVLLHTSWDGRFLLANITFPIGFPQGYSNITATYTPSESFYLPSFSFVQVLVVYRSSTLTASVSPEKATPLDQVKVTGKLVGSDSLPLQDRAIMIRVDEMTVANATTDDNGSFRSTFTVPERMINGTHVLTVAFVPTCDIYAPSNTTLLFLVESATTTMITSTTNPAMPSLLLNVDRAILSGMKLIVRGSIIGAGAEAGSVTIYIDNAETSVVNVSADGTFLYENTISIDTAFGPHSIRVVYNPSCEAYATIFVINTPLTAVVVAGAVLTSSLTAYKFKRRKAPSVTTREPSPQPLIPREKIAETVKAIPLPKRLSRIELLSSINLEKDSAAKVTRTYYLAQDLIKERLDLAPRSNETHREYFDRVTATATYLKEPLGEVVKLFELAEYTSNPVDTTQCRQAALALMRLFKETESKSPQMEQHSA